MWRQIRIVAAAASLFSAVATALPENSIRVADDGGAAKLVPTVVGGKHYGCKCYLGDKCWPRAPEWAKLNTTVGGRLIVNIPPGAPCHNTFNGPLGTVNTYGAANCANVQANYGNEQWTVEQPAAVLWTYFSNETCRPTTVPSESCTLGYYPLYVIMATTKAHIKAGIDFARKNNIRLIIRNTGHDFIGRSTGWGSLVINTHSFQEITWIDSYAGPGSYTGGAVKVGAGVQARAFLRLANQRNPPLVIVTGECPTVGVAGGFLQGGGHGPLTTVKGFAADNVLEIEAITAKGEYVTANSIQNPDLFWALKGGGPASYAAVVSVTVKTFPDIPSAGAVIYTNTTHTNDSEVYWNAVRTFHKWSNHFVDNGLYVYFTIRPGFFRSRPFVAVGKTTAELDEITRPYREELIALGVPFEYGSKQFSTYFDLYIDLFEDEGAGNSALTGGWMFDHDDVVHRNDEIIEAFKVVLDPRPGLPGFTVGHLFNPGYGKPVADSARHPAWSNATNFIIASFLVPFNASLAEKADLQNLLTYTVDEAMRNASRSGCTYVNEADPYQPNWQSHFWGSNYPRLKQIRKKWDPHGVFYAISTPGTEDWEVLPDGTKLCKKL